MVKRVLAYIFMVSAIVIGVVGATVWIMGYRYNLEQQTVERISLIQFQATPNGAQIFVNDTQLGFLTPARDDSIKPGANLIKYKLEGYRDWSKTVNLKPAEVRWLNYARLVPNDIVTEAVASFSGYHQALNSTDGDWILLHQTPEDRTFKLIDISDPRNPKVTDLAVPDGVLGSAASTLDIIEWDSSSNLVLIQNSFGDQREIIRLDRRDVNNSLNLTKLFGATITDPHFLNGDNNVVFGLSDGGILRRFEINSKTISAPLVDSVTSYNIYGDGKLSYVATVDGRQVAGVYYRNKDHPVREYDEAQPTFVNFVHYYRTDYMIIGRGDVFTIVANPLNDDAGEEITVKVPDGMDWMIHNGSGRFIVVGRGEKLVSYDLETNESFNFALAGLDGEPKWLDDYHLSYVVNGEMRMLEFDGANQENLVRSTNFGIFSPDNEYLFSFVIGETDVKLQRSRMIIE